MPRTVMLWALVVAATGCAFDADYNNAVFKCSDGECPSGLVCDAAKRCVTPGSADAGMHVDARHADAPHVDAPVAHALTCSDPGPVAATGGSETGTTTTQANHVTSLCAGAVQNGFDAVYAIELPAAGELRVAIAGSASLDAYVISPCNEEPAMPVCLGSGAAVAGDPIVVTAPTAATYYVVVDSAFAGANGSYTLTLTRP